MPGFRRIVRRRGDSAEGCGDCDVNGGDGGGDGDSVEALRIRVKNICRLTKMWSWWLKTENQEAGRDTEVKYGIYRTPMMVVALWVKGIRTDRKRVREERWKYSWKVVGVSGGSSGGGGDDSGGAGAARKRLEG